MTAPTVTAATENSTREKTRLEKIATELWRLAETESTGELAALRRMAPNDLPPSAFYRIMARAGFTSLGDDKVRTWGRVVHIMAQRPDALRAGDLGASLAAIGASPQRVDMLLSARGTTLDDLARRTAYRLARSAEAFLPYRDLTDLIRFQDGVEADRVRIRVAQSFERARRKD